MQEPEYVLKFDEATIVSEQSGVWRVIKKVCFVVVVIILVGSLVLRVNILKEMSGVSVGTLVALIIFSFVTQKNEWKPSQIELRFYPDKLIIYRDKITYSSKAARREWEELYYADVTRLVLRTESKRLAISSKLHGIYYNYNRDGSLQERPCYDRVTDSGTTINFHFAEHIDIVKEIETHSPLKVKIEDS